MEQKQWDTLGIAPTRDEKAIRIAYYAKLADNNPEDKPEEFKVLRAAYEAALEWAKNTEKPADSESDKKPKTPYEAWQNKIVALYEDLPARCDVERWKALLQDPFCQALASRLAAKDGLLRVLMQHSFLPHRVWKLLNNFFDFEGTKEELYELYPKDFVDYGLINSIKYPEAVPIEAFTDTTGEAADLYVSLANKLRRAMRNGDKEEAKRLLQELEAVPAHHPHTLLAKAKMAQMEGDTDAARELCTAYLTKCPKATDGLLFQAHLMQNQGEYGWALATVEKALEQDADLSQAKYDKICILEDMGELGCAKEELMELHRAQPRNQLLQEKCDELNEKILPELLAKHERAPEDTHIALDLAWCQFQMDAEKQAAAMMEPYAQQLAGEYEYENLMGKLLLSTGRHEEALPHLWRWEKTLQALAAGEQTPVDSAEGSLSESERARRLKRLPESKRLQAICLFDMGQKEAAFAQLQACEEAFPDDAETLLSHAQLLAGDGRSEEAEPLFDRLIQLEPEDGYFHYLRGTYRFRRGEKLPAWQELQAAMQAYGKELHCMSLQCRILMSDDHWEEAEKMLEEMKEIPDSESIDLAFCRVIEIDRQFRLQAKTDSKKAEIIKQQALQGCSEVINRLRAGEKMERAGEVFFLYAILLEGTTEYDELAVLSAEGIRLDPENMRLRDFRAFCLTKQKDYRGAEDTYKEMEKLRPTDPIPVRKLAELYRITLRDFPRAAQEYKKLLALQETAENHARYGKCLQELGEYQQAEEQLLAAHRFDPAQPAFCANLGGLYAAWGKLESAADMLYEALKGTGAGADFYTTVRAQLAHVECRRGRYTQAIALWRQNSESGELDELTDIADVEEHLGNYDEALRLVDEWRQRRPEEDEGWYLRRRGELLQEAGRLREAVAMLRQGAMKYASCLNGLALLYFDEGRYRVAVRLAKKCVDAEPDNLSYGETLAISLYFAGNKFGAAAQARKCLKLLEQQKADNQQALYAARKAKLLVLAGHYEEAMAACLQAHKAPQCSTCNFCHCKDADMAQALLLEATGKYKEALEYLQRGQKAAPEDMDFEAALRRLRKRGVKE